MNISDLLRVFVTPETQSKDLKSAIIICIICIICIQTNFSLNVFTSFRRTR